MEDKKGDTLEDVFLDKDNTHKISLLEKMLNEETFYWNNVPKAELIKYTEPDFAYSVLDGKSVRQLFLSYELDKKVFIFCHLYHWICDRTNTAEELMRVVELFYNIEYSTILKRLGMYCGYTEEYKLLNGLKIVKYIKNKADAPIVKALENEPSLQNVMKYYYQNDIGKALAELRKLYEEDKFQEFIKDSSNEVNFIYYFVIKMASIYAVHLDGKGVDKKRIQKTEFTDRTEKLQNALDEYKNTNGIITNNNDILEKLQQYSGFMFNHMIDQKNLQLAYQDMTETEAQIWFDLGLTLYRLYLRK